MQRPAREPRSETPASDQDGFRAGLEMILNGVIMMESSQRRGLHMIPVREVKKGVALTLEPREAEGE